MRYIVPLDACRANLSSFAGIRLFVCNLSLAHAASVGGSTVASAIEVAMRIHGDGSFTSQCCIFVVCSLHLFCSTRFRDLAYFGPRAPTAEVGMPASVFVINDVPQSSPPSIDHPSSKLSRARDSVQEPRRRQKSIAMRAIESNGERPV